MPHTSWGFSLQPALSNSLESITIVNKPVPFSGTPTELSCAKFTITITGLFLFHFLNDIGCPMALTNLQPTVIVMTLMPMYI